MNPPEFDYDSPTIRLAELTQLLSGHPMAACFDAVVSALAESPAVRRGDDSPLRPSDPLAVVVRAVMLVKRGMPVGPETLHHA